MKITIHALHCDVRPTEDEVKTLCRPGHGADTCSWLMMDANGWYCSGLNKPPHLIERRESGDMNAMRDGCDKVNSFSAVGMTGEVEI